MTLIYQRRSSASRGKDTEDAALQMGLLPSGMFLCGSKHEENLFFKSS